MSWRPRSMRARLALAYAGTFALLLALHDVAIYAWVRHEAFEALEHEWTRGVPPEEVDRGPKWQAEVASVEHELDEVIAAMLLLGAPGAALAGLLGFLLARRALAPVDRLASHAERITAERLSERIPVADPNDELGRLAVTFNAMTARLDQSFGALRRFTANASHELRTPLTAMRTVGEVALRDGRDATALRDVVGSMLEEIDGLTRLVESLLTLARADDGKLRPELAEADLAQMARRVVDQLAPLADERRQRVASELDAPLPVRADAVLLRRAIANLLDNAIRYSPPGSAIAVRATARDGEGALEVVDAGPGIAPADQERLFERFHRLDASRTRDGATGEGAGLGLALARKTVQAHGGRIEIDSAPGEGATFRIVLPLAPEGGR